MLSFLPAFTMIVAFQALAYGLAHLFLDRIKLTAPGSFSKSPSAMVAFGFTLIIIVAYISCLSPIIYAIAPISLMLLSVLGIILTIQRRLRAHASASDKGTQVSRFVIWLVTNSLMAHMIAYMKWPPFGDPLTHMMITSLIMFHKSIPVTYHPLSSAPFYYPSGFHTLAALVSSVTSMYPGEVILIESGVIFSVLLLLATDMAFEETNNVLLAVVVPLLLLCSSGTKYLTEYLFGYFLNGTYPMILGSLGILLFVFLLSRGRSDKDYVVAILIFLFELVTYPVFALFLIVPFLLSFGKSIESPYRSVLTGKKQRLFLAGLSIIALIIAVMIWPRLTVFVQNAIYLISTVRLVREYIVEPRFLLMTPVGIALFVYSLMFFFSLLMKKKMPSYHFVIISMCIPALVNVVLPTFEPIGFLVPLRSVVAASPLLYLSLISMIRTGIQALSRASHTDKCLLMIVVARGARFRTRFTFSSIAKSIIGAILVIILLPELIDVISLKTLNTKSWLWVNNEGFEDDYIVCQWMSKNNPFLKVLVDYSQPARQLIGFGYVNTTVYDMDLLPLIKNPFDYFLVRSLLIDKGIQRIYISSDWGFYDFIESGISYTAKPFSNSQYLEAFREFTFIEYRSGQSVVLRVTNLSKPMPIPIPRQSSANKSAIWYPFNDGGDSKLLNVSIGSERAWSLSAIYDSVRGFNLKFVMDFEKPEDFSDLDGLSAWLFINSTIAQSEGFGLLLIDENGAKLECRVFQPGGFKTNKLQHISCSFKVNNDYNRLKIDQGFDIRKVIKIVLFVTPTQNGVFVIELYSLTLFRY